jgi:hypothetical protein
MFFRRIACLILLSGWLLSASAQAQTKFGIVYTGWHCLVTKAHGGRPFSVISEALAGRQRWGPIPEFHFWGEPRDGFYCLSERPDILARHAEALRDAGIDFIVFDATNAEYADVRTQGARDSVMDPYDKLLEVWTKIRGAPTVVPWAPMTRRGNMLEWMIARLDALPELEFIYDGKPLALITSNATFEVDNDKVARIADLHTVRRMWGGEPSATESWTFLSACQKGFLASRAHIACRQQRAMREGKVEEVSVATAYQETYMSYKETAVPKFHGRTFVRQFETVFESKPQVALISGWNEWMAQRFCLDSHNEATDKGCNARNDHWPDGSKVFVDQYDANYNRDIEPQKGAPGDFYYQLMKQCIAEYRQGRSCRETDIK